ncbi:hypothetical protein AHAS_Ahas03G0045400 [Arachis hypogaea]
MGQLQRDMTNLNQRSMEVDDVRSDLNDVSKDSTPKDVPVTVISGHEQSKIFQAKLQLPSSSQDLNSDDVPILEVFSIYACLRSFSTLLFLSPFTLEDLVAALKSKTLRILIEIFWTLSHDLFSWPKLESESRSLVCSLEWKSNIAH